MSVCSNTDTNLSASNIGREFSLNKISTSKTMDVLPKLSSRPILNMDGLVSVLLHTDTLEDILLVKSAAPSFRNTCCNISY